MFSDLVLIEASKKDLPPAPANGTAVWDGGAVTTRRFTPAQTTLLDQWLSPKGETKERMKELSPEKEDDMRPDADKEQLIAVLHYETKNEAASKISEVQPAVKEKEAETRNEPQQDNVEDPEHDDGEIIHSEVFNVKQNADPEQELRAQLECLLMEDSTRESAYPVQKTIKTPSLEDSATPAELCIQETTGPIQEQIQTPRVEESTTPTKTTAEVTECWDEYVAATADEMHGGESSKLIFASLLSNTQTHLTLSRQHDTQSDWHFPTGPGLREEVQCPLWPFPEMSYYPPIEPTVPFEGEDQNLFTIVIFPQ